MANGEPAEAGSCHKGASDAGATVAVIIPTFNHAHFLRDAIQSALAQTCLPDEIIVVDDGSTDDPAAVVAQFDGVRLIQQANRGLSAARNVGLRSCSTDFVVFLDADDRLLSNAVESGLACMAAQPECAFVYGGYRFISREGRPIGPALSNPASDDARIAFLRGDAIAVHTALFRRDCLLAVGGFDETLKRCEDYDLYLRMVQKFRIARHPEIIAEYRRHGENMSSVHSEQLKTVLLLLDRHQSGFEADIEARAALRQGRAQKQKFFIDQMLEAAMLRWHARHGLGTLTMDLIKTARWSPSLTVRALLAAVARRASSSLPRGVVRGMERIRGRPYPVPVGSVSFGDFRRSSPISGAFGWDRGSPIDRYYIEEFLTRNADDIRGRVLEASDNVYTRRFGGARVERSDVLCVESDNPNATIVGDLAQPGTLPEAAFDCIVLTQTLQFIFDLRAGLGNVYRALKPGGVLLVTVPGLTKMYDSWPFYWTFSAAAVHLLLEDQFGQGVVSVETHGNVFAAAAFLHGVAFEETERAELDIIDPDFPVIVAARATKRNDA